MTPPEQEQDPTPQTLMSFVVNYSHFQLFTSFQLFVFLKLSIELFEKPATALHLGRSLRGPMARLSRYPWLAYYKGSYNFTFAFA